MARRPRPAPAWVARLAWLPVLALLAACAGQAPPAQEPAPPDQEQPLVIRVLDAKDNPVAGARVDITARAGQPARPGPYVTDGLGLLSLSWRPQVVEDSAAGRVSDRIFSYVSRLDYRIEQAGFLPATGSLEAVGHGRSMAQAELKKLDRAPLLTRQTRTVNLRRLADLLGPGLAGRPEGDPLAARCLAYYQKNRDLMAELGVRFAWPSFVLRGQRLSVRLDWAGQTWAAMGKAPLIAQVALGSGVPIAITLGEDLLPAPGVAELSLEILDTIAPQGQDAHAAPQRVRVELAAPAPVFAELAAGRLTPDAFLLKHPPRLIEEGAVAATPFGGER
ncbi:MAG: hypothetical protein ACOZHQ_08225 [Thermodesulfobacteriota bacterium]